MPSLKTRALEALEGSDRSDAAFAAMCSYIDDVEMRIVGELAVTNVDHAVELLALLGHLKAVADPTGDSAYHMKIVRRVNRPGPAPNPANQRKRANSAMFAAAHADRMLDDNPGMQKKMANSLAAERFGVTPKEIYAARNEPLYLELRARSQISKKT